MFWLILIAIIISLLLLKDTSPASGTKHTIETTVKNIRELDIRVGDEVNLWVSSKNDIYVYIKGSGGGRGKIGTFRSRSVIKKLEQKETVAKITDIYNKSVTLEITTI